MTRRRITTHQGSQLVRLGDPGGDPELADRRVGKSERLTRLTGRDIADDRRRGFRRSALSARRRDDKRAEQRRENQRALRHRRNARGR